MAVKKIEELNIHRDVNSTEQFDVQGYLNENWDKMQDVVDNNAEELTQVQKDISTLKEDNKTNKSRIDVLEKSNETRDGKISKNTEDIEAIQGSIKTATETINKKDNEQDEDIKANKESIEELQAENLEIKAENERLREDIKSIATIGEASGENIHLEDSSDARCELEICGNHQQDTREGYNQFKITSTQTQSAGVTITKIDESSVSYQGTTTGMFTHILVEYDGNGLEITKQMYLKAFGNLTNANFSVKIIKSGETEPRYLRGSPDLILDVGDILQQVYVQQQNTGILVSGTLQVLLTDYENKDKSYEQYGASPSIDYPSKAKSVGDNINMLFTNPDDWEQGTITDGANVSSMTRIRTKNFIDIIDNEDYYVSIQNTQYCFLNIVLYKEDKTYIGQYYSLNNAINGANHLKINLPTNAKKIRVIIRNLDNVSDISPSDIEMIKPKLEKSSVATPYSSYNCGSLKTKIGNKNHLSTIPRVTFSLQGIQTTFDGEKFTCKGTAMYNYFNLVTQRIQQHFKAGTYTFSSNMFEKGRACIRFYYEDGTADTYYSNINTRKISFTLKKDAYEYFLMIDGLTVVGGDVIDCIIKLQLEDGNTSTEIVKAENQEFVVDVQQPMLEGDKFIKTDGKWYEKHCVKTEIMLTFPTNNIEVCGTFANFQINRNIAFAVVKNDLKITNVRNDILCDKLKAKDNSMWGGKEEGIQTYINSNKFMISIPFEDIEKNFGEELTINNYSQAFRKYINDNGPFKIYYLLEEPELIECTEAQNKVLDEIYNKSHTYKNITNISSESAEVNPIVSLKYLKDVEAEHNKLQAQIDEIKQLLSTTETSALLVNNLEKDLRMEVE